MLEQDAPIYIHMLDLEVNDILYTKDGRNCGNLTIVDKFIKNIMDPSESPQFYYYKAVSDYGKMIELNGNTTINRQFFVETGKADKTHKYYDYKEQYPELFI